MYLILMMPRIAQAREGRKLNGETPFAELDCVWGIQAVLLIFTAEGYRTGIKCRRVIGRIQR